jgi:wyosine [tRNA(Phe)-imidazoG37] synthetase (radical SAM superfamily)
MSDNITPEIIFGTVPSRRLGRSLGVNNIPPKYCSYSCIYCQLGRNKKKGITRQQFYEPAAVMEQVEKKINDVYKRNEHIDYISFVPDGEPVLDSNIGSTIKLLKRTGLKIAVITNSSLMSDEKARRDIMEADWVSLKIDAVSENIWRVINRPYKLLDIEKIHNGMIDFSGAYQGELVTETMLVDEINTGIDEVGRIADFIKILRPQMSYLSIPIRPPAEKRAVTPDEYYVNRAYQILLNRKCKAECITGHEGNDFVQTGDVTRDILSITSVHPMREDSLRMFVKNAGADWRIIEQLKSENKISETEYNNNKFYLRKFDKSS